MYHLVIEYRPGDFMPIDINILAENNNNYFTLEAIDSFTKKYTKNEIMDMIIDNNLVPEEYFSGSLKIINEKKYRYPLITKNDTFSFDTFFKDNFNNKQVMNKFINIFYKYSDNIENIKIAIQNQNLKDVYDILFSLSYEKVRFIYVYLKDLK